MLLILYSCRAGPGQAEAIRALYREWQQLLNKSSTLSTELLSNVHDPGELIMLARSEDENAAWRAAESASHRAWYAQLVQRAEAGPIVSQYRMI